VEYICDEFNKIRFINYLHQQFQHLKLESSYPTFTPFMWPLPVNKLQNEENKLTINQPAQKINNIAYTCKSLVGCQVKLLIRNTNSKITHTQGRAHLLIQLMTFF
jgi:hypothetical protein